MKHRDKGRILQMVLLLVMGLLLVGALLLPRFFEVWPRPRSIGVSVLIRENDSALWNKARQGMEQAAIDLGAEFRFLTPQQSNSAEEQMGILTREIEGGSDALILVPASASVLDTALAGPGWSPPVVTLESAHAAADASILTDNGAIGTALAQALLADVPQGRVLLVDTAGESAGAAERLDAARATLVQSGRTVVVRRERAQNLAQNGWTMVVETGARAMMVFEPAATQFAATGLQGSCPLYGVGATGTIAAGVERGTVTASAAWSEYASGYLAMQSAVEAAQGRPESMTLDFFLVRKENLYEPEMQKLLFHVTD